MHFSSITLGTTTLFFLATSAAAVFGHGDGLAPPHTTYVSNDHPHSIMVLRSNPPHSLHSQSEPRPDTSPLSHPTKPAPPGHKLSHTMEHIAGDVAGDALLGALLRRAPPDPPAKSKTTNNIAEVERESHSISANVKSAEHDFQALRKSGGSHDAAKEAKIQSLFDQLMDSFRRHESVLHSVQSGNHRTGSKKGPQRRAFDEFAPRGFWTGNNGGNFWTGNGNNGRKFWRRSGNNGRNSKFVMWRRAVDQVNGAAQSHGSEIRSNLFRRTKGKEDLLSAETVLKLQNRVRAIGKQLDEARKKWKTIDRNSVTSGAAATLKSVQEKMDADFRQLNNLVQQLKPTSYGSGDRKGKKVLKD